MAGKPLKHLLYQPHLLPRKPSPASHLSLILFLCIQRRQQQRCQLKIQTRIDQCQPTLRPLPLLPQAHFLLNRKRFRTPMMQFGQRFLPWRKDCQRRMVRKQGHQDWTLTHLLPPTPLLPSFPSLEVVSALGVLGEVQQDARYLHPHHPLLWLLILLR